MHEQGSVQDAGADHRHLLLVEDEALIALAEKRTLEKHGFTVTTANTREKAVETATADSGVDLILMDIDLGEGMDGTEAAERILETHDLPIVFLTGHSEKEYVDRVKKITSYGYVLKSSGEFVLVESINMALELFDARRREEEKERQLREQNAYLDFYRLAVDAIDDQKVSIVDSDYRYRVVNERYSRDSGMHKEQIVGKSVAEILGSNAFQAIKPEIDRCFAGESVEYSRWFEFPQAGKRYMEVSYYPLRNKRDEIDCIAGIIKDSTEEKQAKRQLEEALEFQKIISDISSRFVKTTEGSFDEDINTMLAQIGEHFRVDRSYLFLLSDDHDAMTNTHEWCREGVSPQMHRIQNEPTMSFPWWTSQVLSQDFIHVPDLEALPDEAGPEKQEFRRQGIQSYIEIPVRSGDETWGFVGFDAVRERYSWSNNEIENLMTIASNLGHLLLRLRSEKMLKEAKTRAEEGEKKSRESEEYYRLLAENIQDVVVSLDLESECFTYVSPSVEKVFGYTVDEVLSMTLQDLQTQDSHARHQQEVRDVIDGKTNTRRFEREVIHKSGHIVPVEVHATFLRDGTDIPKATVSVVRDISERKEKEHALIRAGEEQRMLLDTIPTQIWYLKDVETYGSVNQAHADFFGMQRQDMEGKSLYDLMSTTEEADVCIAGNRKVFTKKQQIYSEEAVLNAAGEERLLSIIKTPKLDRNENVEYVVCSAEDVTERKEKEEQVRKALEEKDSLLRELNHRVKNNLSMVSSLIDLKESTFDDHADLSDLRNRINAIRKVHEVLQYSDEVTHVNLKEYVGGILSNVLQSSGRRTITIENDLPDISVSTKTAIPLGLIVNERATNALKHGFVGEVEPRFTVSMDQDGKGYYMLTASNTGKPFPRHVDIENPQTLGLQLISALVSQLDGTLEVEREPQPVFRIRLPMSQMEK